MPRPLSFREIEAFRAVMLTGTTTAAAAMLHTTQPSVSRLLSQMQAAAELKLFDIDKGRLRPTQEARTLFESVQNHFQGLARIEQDVAALRKSGTGMLRVGCTPSLGLGVLPAVVGQFSARHADIHLNLQTVGAHALRDGLLTGRFDLVLSTSPLDHPQFDVRIMHKSHAVCVMHPDHPLSRRPSLHVRDLAGQSLITLNADDPLHVALRESMRRVGAEPAATIETTYSGTICTMAAQGTGIGIVNQYVANVFAHALRVVPLSPRCPVDARMAFSGHWAPSAIAEAFAALVAAHFRTLRPASNA
ncbi:LysR substrate-binding domain-containing protein [Cupriavidus sp. NPDC089707]|uniref:LysR substrate-binding domain-containing protein n=1 Tax=Cupriavidus sp. NPDC089707 TaxID=3363963 RepID=UPI00380855AE